MQLLVLDLLDNHRRDLAAAAAASALAAALGGSALDSRASPPVGSGAAAGGWGCAVAGRRRPGEGAAADGRRQSPVVLAVPREQRRKAGAERQPRLWVGSAGRVSFEAGRGGVRCGQSARMPYWLLLEPSSAYDRYTSTIQRTILIVLVAEAAAPRAPSPPVLRAAAAAAAAAVVVCAVAPPCGLAAWLPLSIAATLRACFLPLWRASCIEARALY